MGGGGGGGGAGIVLEADHEPNKSLSDRHLGFMSMR